MFPLLVLNKMDTSRAMIGENIPEVPTPSTSRKKINRKEDLLDLSLFPRHPDPDPNIQAAEDRYKEKRKKIHNKGIFV
jgi:hypothetical protein